VGRARRPGRRRQLRPETWRLPARSRPHRLPRPHFTVRSDVSDARAAKTLAHVLLHDGTEYSLGRRGLIEVEAESVAYVVATAAGLATDAYSLPYVAHWADGSVNAVKARAERVITTAHAILCALVDSQAHTADLMAS
jgi:hypothetical protein